MKRGGVFCLHVYALRVKFYRTAIIGTGSKFALSFKIGCISGIKINFLRFNFVFLKFCTIFADKKYTIRNNMSKEIPSREELLLRVEASKERKRKCLAEMEVRARELFKERTGNEPKYVYSL